MSETPAVNPSKPWTRHERIGECDLYLGDCLGVMEEIGDRIDAIVSDPPYGIGYVHGAEKRKHASKHNERPILGDDKPFDPSPFLGWDCLLWGANHFAPRLPGGGAGSSGISATAEGSMINPTLRSLGEADPAPLIV